MRKRSNPWPAFVDLFSALLIAAFGGLMLLSAAYQHRVEHEVVVSDVRSAADALHERLLQAIGKQEKLKSRVRSCGDDTCIDLYIHFPRGQDKILDTDENSALHDLAGDLRNGLDQLQDRRDVEVIVEGHTDSSLPVDISDPRILYLYNWNLSAKRASSVVYEFRNERLTTDKYKIVAIGKADSDPLPCSGPSSVCDDNNRRTTLRLHIDTLSIEQRLRRIPASVPADQKSGR